LSSLGLYIAASGLNADQIGLETVSQDIANANTPQYAQQMVNLSAVQGSSFHSGGGVGVTSVSQVTEAVITSAMLAADGMLSEQQAANTVLTSAQSLFPEPNGEGIQKMLSQFWSQWDTVANEPTNTGAREALVTSAQQLAAALNQASNGLTNLQSQTLNELQSTVTQANNLLSQVAQLNQQIATAVAGNGDVNSLLDQQRQNLDQLSQLIGTTYVTNANGSVNVYLSGLELVQGNSTLPQTPPPPPLTVQVTGTGASLSTQVLYQATPTATPVAVPPLGGKAAGLQAAIGHLDNYQSSINNVAVTLASTVNSQQAAGYYWAGPPGSAPSATGSNAYQGNQDTLGNPLTIFGVGGSASVAGLTAANIAVNSEVVQDPYYLAASSQPPTVSSFAPVSIPLTVTAGVNDTIDATVNGTAYVLTIAAGTYSSSTALQTALQAAATSAGAPLTFTVDSAGNLTVSVSGPGSNMSLQLTGGSALGSLNLQVAASTAPAAQQNNGFNAQKVAELSNSTSGADAIYQSFIAQLGSDVQTSTNQMNAQQATTTAADNNFQAVSGVSTDQETVQMQLFQNAYQAMAKVVTSVEAAFESLLSAV